MSNQRSKKKKLVGGYVNYKLKDAIKSIALEEDKTQTKIVEMLLREGVERYKLAHPEPENPPTEKDK